MSRWVEGIVVGQTQWSAQLFSLYVKAPIDSFTAGQFTHVGLMQDDTLVFRPYSFVNAPEDETLEFYYTVLPHGVFTPTLSQRKGADNVFISKKSFGRFTLENVPEGKTLWMIATGTGLGVFLSLLRTQRTWERFQKIVVVHSVRHSAELTHQTILADLCALFAGRLEIISIVTREKHHALSERIPALISKGILESKAGVHFNPHDTQVMLCGNPAMVQEVTAVLQTRGLKLNHRCDGEITIESYWKDSAQSTPY